MFSTIKSYKVDYTKIIEFIEYFTLIVFSIEYVLRFIACREIPKYAEKFGYIKFLFSPSSIVSLLSIVPIFFLKNDDIIVIFRLFRVLKLLEYTSASKILLRAVASKKQELLVTFSIVLFLIVLSSSIMYFVEHAAQPDKFTSIPGTMYWAIATLTTVGYGDIYPITPVGKALTCIIAILGVAIFALPAGIFASGFSDNVSQKKPDIFNKLRELDELRELNIITQDEFVNIKKKIIAK